MQNNLAFVFPGQGSQAVGMLADLGDNEVVKSTFQEASDALGYDVWQLIQDGPSDKLNQTNYTQPALLTASVAIWRAWQAENGAKPAYLAGHSLGEYSALVCAGVLSLADAATLVEKRGQFMQASVPEGVGAMAAVIGLDDEVIIDACEKAAESQVVSAVNFNSTISPGTTLKTKKTMTATAKRVGIINKILLIAYFNINLFLKKNKREGNLNYY